ncbi:MAG: PorT family protein [Sphingobacteriaceae bacterium]|nr:MAG: PorT family protein [Sphingobacteriaceae bacterium]
MKKILLSICLTAASLATFSQSDKPVTFGIKGGVNFSRLPYSNLNSPATTSANTLTSFNVGVFVDFKLCESLSIQPALIYTGKGGRNNINIAIADPDAPLTISHTDTMKVYYIQVPVNVVYSVPVGSHSFYFGAGPFVGYGISGKQKSKLIFADDQASTTSFYNEDVKFGSDEPSTVKRWDYGVGALAGFKFNNGFLLNINYDLGLANTTPKSEDNNNKTKTRVFGVSVGYAF